MKKNILWLLSTWLLVSCAISANDNELPTTRSTTDSLAETVAEFSESSLPAGFDVEGHRGARGLKPENTLPAFETALDLGVTTLELDLHLTADHKVVIWHDDTIDEEKCGLQPDAPAEARDPDSLIKWGDGLMISQMTLAEIAVYRCDRNPDPDQFPEQSNSATSLAGDDYRITTLADLFRFVETYSQSELKSEAQRNNASQVQFNIETKRKPDSPKAIDDDFNGENPGAFELEILKLIKEFGLQERVVIQSFDHRSLWAIRSVNAQIRLAALTSGRNADITGFAAQGAAIWSPRYTDLTPALVSKAHKSGLQVIPWTVNDRDDMLDQIELGVDGIISDRPDILLALEP